MFRTLSWIFFHWLYSPLGPWPLFFSFTIIFTDGRTPWTSDQFVTRPLPKQRTTQTQNKHIHISNIQDLSGIRTHDPSVRASEDSSCLRPLGYCDRHSTLNTKPKLIYEPYSCVRYGSKICMVL
jgi:hypothetical protein